MKKFAALIRKRYLLAICLLIPMLLHAQEDWNPIADPAAVVVSGNVRFTVLTSQMIRIQYSSNAQFEDRATFAVVNRRLPVPDFTAETEDGYLIIKTEHLTLRYKTGTVPKVTDKKPDNLSIAFEMNGQECLWYPGKDDALNLMGTNRTLDQAWGDSRRGDLEKGLLSRAGWAIIDESPKTKRGDGSTSFVLAPNEDGFLWWNEPVDKNATDWYFLGYGHEYRKCLGDFVRIAGRVPMPPKYIFGYWYSRYWAYRQTEFQQIIRDAESNDVPLDVVIMDMDWHKSGWTGWSWNKTLIPTPKNLISWMHSHGVKTALNLHPADGVGSHEDNYAAMKADLGYDSGYKDAIPWTIERYDFYKALFKNIIRPHEDEGVDFWWQDWQQHLLVNDVPGLGETFWINHVFFEDMRRNRPNLRPVIYHRWGGLGSHRYPICFSGDAWAAWSTLAYEIYFTSTASNVCYDYWGHDLGGHQGGNNDPELLQRWLQFGVYTPIFRTHATNDSKLERRIWKYPNFEQLRETIRLRYQLFPYLYTAARETYETGVGMNRPLYYDWPEENNAYRFEDEYMFGNDILVAPIYTPSENGYSHRRIWLPEGKWWDVTKHTLREGGTTFTSSFTTDEFPVYYRPGAIIVNYPVQRTVQTTPDEIVLRVVPGADGTGRFYEDDGTNQDYADGKMANTYFSQTHGSDGVTLRIAPREGTYEGIPAERAWRIIFLGQAKWPQNITLDGEPVSQEQVSFDEATGEVTVLIPTTACDREIVLKMQGIRELPCQPKENDNEVVNEGARTQTTLYVTGSAVPGGEVIPLEKWEDGTFKFHGPLLPGELYIITTSGIRATTRFYAPRQAGSTIVNDGISYSAVNSQDQAAWTVPFAADNYRFTVSTTSRTVSGELFTWWYETWIVGGCTEDGQGSWRLEAGKPMVQNPVNPYEWTWVGELRNYTANVESKRFKILGQYGWNPKSLHPYRQDASILKARQAIYNNSNDYKWTIGEDGYYRITCNVFLETVTGEYLGSELPDGIESTRQSGVSIDAHGRTLCVTAGEPVTVTIHSPGGQQMATLQGAMVSWTAPWPGIYLLEIAGEHTRQTQKFLVK